MRVFRRHDTRIEIDEHLNHFSSFYFEVVTYQIGTLDAGLPTFAGGLAGVSGWFGLLSLRQTSESGQSRGDDGDAEQVGGVGLVISGHRNSPMSAG
ncbi:hypothetical protein D3C76_1486890 [compost metagenome]